MAHKLKNDPILSVNRKRVEFPQLAFQLVALELGMERIFAENQFFLLCSFLYQSIKALICSFEMRSILNFHVAMLATKAVSSFSSLCIPGVLPEAPSRRLLR